MSRAAPDIVSGTGRVDIKVIFNNERVIVGSREYLVEHIFTYGLKSADVVFDKSNVEGVIIYGDQPVLNYMDNTLTLGLDENKLVYGEALEEVVLNGNNELKLISKPFYMRLISNGDKVFVTLNNRRNYEVSKAYLHIEPGVGSNVVNILVNPVKILWLFVEEALANLIVEKDQIKIRITRLTDK